ncbi:MAG: hypothetical protein AMXMBFR64_05560 [Myxococcales bacterium]
MSFEHTAGYGFVPLSHFAFCPSWAAAVSQDIPFADGLSGTLELELSAQSPLFVRAAGTDEDPSRPRAFQLPGGGYAVPGGTVRGMLRSIVETAAFGYLSRVNDHKYAVRDLRNRTLYGDHMAGIMPRVNGKPEPMPKVGAGWLVKDRGNADKAWVRGECEPGEVVARIEPCSFAKVEYSYLVRLAEQVRGRFDPGARQGAPRKYAAWSDLRLSLTQTFNVELLRDHGRLSGVLGAAARQRQLGHYGRVSSIPGKEQGTLVFTGQPSPYRPNAGPKRKGAGNPKHHDFMFWDLPGASSIPVSWKQFQEFEFIHSDRGQQNNLGRSESPNDEWKHWLKEKWDNDDVPLGEERIPVFYLFDDRAQVPTLRAFGLAMMFRLAYRNSVRDAIKSVQGEHVFEPISGEPGHGRQPDFAETLFGYASESRAKTQTAQALKGRVSVGTFTAAPGTVKVLPPVTAVLAGPKASYYPNYIEQSEQGPPGAPPARGIYRTFMDDKPQVRGRKRYRSTTEVLRPPLPRGGQGQEIDTGRVATTFSPLAPGACFTGRIRVHNLLPVELGALLWALDFGGDATCLHKLGLAKALGYGQVRLAVRGAELLGLSGPVDATAVMANARASFERLMEAACARGGVPGGWAGSAQIAELRALARPVASAQARTFLLNNGDSDPRMRNEFERAKAERTALPSATDWSRHPGGPPPLTRVRQEAGIKTTPAQQSVAEPPPAPVSDDRKPAVQVTQASLPAAPNFARDLFNLQPGTAAQLLPRLIERWTGTEHQPRLRDALRAHPNYPWLKKQLDKRWAQGLRELLDL